jgi:serine/threonine-protein kinase RsbW
MSTPVATAFRRVYTSSLDASRLAAEELNIYWLNLGVPSGLATQLELCVVEMVNNAFIHGYRNKEGQPVELCCYLERDGDCGVLSIRISDEGQTMSQEELDAALSNEFIEADPDDEQTWKTSGRGFLIVSSLMDRIELVREGEKNTFVMMKHLDRTSMQHVLLSLHQA